MLSAKASAISHILLTPIKLTAIASTFIFTTKKRDLKYANVEFVALSNKQKYMLYFFSFLFFFLGRTCFWISQQYIGVTM
jgi:hypothetical protein